MNKRYSLQLLVLFSLSLANATAQNPRIDFETYNPVSTLIVPEHRLTKAKYPFIDVHNHQPQMATQNLSALLAAMDSLNMKVMVNLTGIGGDRLKAMADKIQQADAKRLLLFTNLDFRGFGDKDWTEAAVKRLQQDVTYGAKGLKIFKELGLTYKDNRGDRIPVDDPRLDAVWQTCGELGIPVLIHSAAPRSFWDPKNNSNERLLEMTLYADRVYTADRYASWEQIIQEQH